MARRIGGRAMRNAKAGFDPAAGRFLVAPLTLGAFEGVIVVPFCGEEFSGAGGNCAAQTSAKLIEERAEEFAEFTNAVGSAAPASGMTESTVEVTVTDLVKVTAKDASQAPIEKCRPAVAISVGKNCKIKKTRIMPIRNAEGERCRCWAKAAHAAARFRHCSPVALHQSFGIHPQPELETGRPAIG
jgi:hypothetical protein